MILSHIQRNWQPWSPKSESSRLSLVCKRWSSVLRPCLFFGITLRTREDLSFLLSIVKSPLSRWLADSLFFIKIEMKEVEAHQPRLSSSFWKDIREHLPATKTLQFKGPPSDRLFPWRDRIFLHTYTHIQAMCICDFIFPSSSSLLRLLSSLPSLQLVCMSDVAWPGEASRLDKFRLLQAPPQCPMSIPNAKTFISHFCTDDRFPTWLFAGMCSPL